MSKLDEIIEKYYSEYLYPNLDALYKLMKADNISVTKKDIKAWLDKQEEVQVTKETKQVKSDNGHIVAFTENQIWQLDIFILQKYVKFNKGYRDILAVVDVFTRQAYCMPMKNKGIKYVVEAIEKIFKLHGYPEQIISDTDSSFMGGDFQKLLDKHDIIHDTVPIGSHESLGIVDRFARTIKTKFTRIIEKNKVANWIDYIDKVVNQYNNTPHSSLLDIKPSQANDGDNVALIVHLNHLKSLKNSNVSDLSTGDKVRILETSYFKKGTEPRYSKEIFTVKTIQGQRITLTNGKVKKRNVLLLIPKDTKESDNNKHLIAEITKENQNEQLYKREELKESNIRTSKRGRIPNRFRPIN